MPTYDTACLYSTVKNTSGQRKKFGFLPPHGRELDVDEEFTIYGDAREAVLRFERVTDRRQIMAFEAAIERGDIKIIQTPSPVLQDVDTGESKILELDGGVLSAVDPCWEESVSV